MTPRRLIAAALPVLGALLLTAGTSAQSGRFAGWEALRDPGFEFDPDQRTIRGYSVRTSTSARGAFDEVEQALDAGDARAAAQRLLAIAAGDPSAVLQVGGCLDCGDERSRWVGAAEFALYQLATRLPDSIVDAVGTPEDRAAVATATTWRDAAALRLLARRLEGLPEGRLASEALARLSAERGEFGTAAGAATRALAGQSDPELAELLARVAPPTRAEPPSLEVPPELQTKWSHDLTVGQLSDRTRFNPFTAHRSPPDAPAAPVDPVVAEGVVYVADSLSVTARDLISGRELWHHAGPLEQREIDRDPEWFDYATYASSLRPRAISPYQICRPTLSDDLVLATVQVTERFHPLDTFENYPINHPLPHRRLVALDRRSGEVVWTQERPSLAPDAFENRFDAVSPAVVGDGMVFVSGSITEGSIIAYVAAFDLATGELRWRSMLCSGQQELTMFNRPFQEHVVSPVALVDGALYVSTNLGVVASLDAWSGRVRWLAAYDSIPRESSRGVRPNSPRTVYWTNQLPFVEGGTLFVAPLDSRSLLALDPATGRRRLEPIPALPVFDRQLRQQAVPTGRGRVLLVAREGVQALDAKSGRALGGFQPFPSGMSLTGVATPAGDVLLVPVERSLLMVDLADGLFVDGRSWPLDLRSVRDVQRVVSAGPALVLSDGERVSTVLNTSALRASLAASAEASPTAALALAELALADGDFDEARARFQSVLDAGIEPLAERAASGRLEATLRRARLASGVEAWEAVLAASVTDDQLFEHAPEAFAGLAGRGAFAAIGRWLSRMAERAPERPLVLGRDGARPVAFLALEFALDGASPGVQVDLLQRIVQEHPEVTWEGVPARDLGQRRIDALLAEHGRALYARHEAAAQRELADGRSLSAVELRYPSSQVVAQARVGEMERLLDASDARAVIALSAGRSGDAVLGPRRRAAEALGERPYADFLGGARAPVRTSLDRLPSGVDEGRTFVLSERFRVVFPELSGRADPEFAGLAFGCLDGAGEMFAIDTARGELAWSGRALPRGLTQASSSVASFHLEGDLLVAQGRGTFAGMRLSDGTTVWQADVPGRTLDVVAVGGLLVVLHRGTDQLYSITALGAHTGETMFRFDLPDCSDARLARAGGTCVVLTRSTPRDETRLRDKRLSVIDLRRGGVSSAMSVDDSLSLVATLDDPPLALLSRRLDGLDGRRTVGPLSELAAFDPVAGTFVWKAELDVELLSSERILEVGGGRLAVRASARRPESTRRVDRLIPCDAATGRLPEPADVPLLELVQGQTRRPAPTLVLRDPLDVDRLVLLDGPSLAARGSLRLPPGSGGHLQVFHGSDGFALVAEPLEGPSSLFLVRGTAGPDVSRTVLDDLPQDGTEVRLVDGAVLVASRGTVSLLRGSSR